MFAELHHVVLQRLELEAQLVGDVVDLDLAEVGEPGLGADRGELGAADLDLVVAAGARVGEGLERGGLAMRKIVAFGPIFAVFVGYRIDTAKRRAIGYRLNRSDQVVIFSAAADCARGRCGSG